MAVNSWKSAVSGDWSSAALWSGGLPTSGSAISFPLAGPYVATIGASENFTVASLDQSGGTIQVLGNLSLSGAATIEAGGLLLGNGTISANGTVINDGTVLADATGFLNLNGASITNAGTFWATNQGVLFITTSSGGSFTNLAGGTLTGGSYQADTNSDLEFIPGPYNFAQLDWPVSTVTVDNATITLNGVGSDILGYAGSGAYNDLEATLTTIAAAGTLNLLGGRGFTTFKALTNNGVVALAGGTVAAASLANNAGAVLVGYGTIAPEVVNGGLVEAQAGTLDLAGGVSNTGALRVDPNATLAFAGSYGQAITNFGTIAAMSGRLALTGAITGNGSFFIEGGTQENLTGPGLISGPATTLDLATATGGTVIFNGAGAVLQLGAASGFTGGITGFGAGDTIDLPGLVSNNANLSGNTLEILNNGATVDSIAFTSAAGLQFNGTTDGAGGTLITATGSAPQDFELEGQTWATRTITWSLASFQFSDNFDTTHAFSSFINPTTQAADVSVIEQALARWAGIAGLNFVQETTDSAAVDIRIGWGDLLGTGGEIGQAAYQYSGGNFVPGSLVRLEDPAQDALVASPGVIGGLTYAGFLTTFYQVALHEIGHALGLDHSTNAGAVMFPTAQGVANQDLSASDIAGIEALYTDVPCFAAGTRVLTAAGPRAVEALRPGDLVATVLSGRLRPVRWIGRRRVLPRGRPALCPVRVLAGAFGPGRPGRDLWLSPDHAVFADGALVPIRHLVNGATIRREDVDAVTYVHVELAGPDGAPVHDVLLAEGLAAESFLDTGNRDSFGSALHPSFARQAWDEGACAPLLEGGPAVVRLRAGLLDIATALGHDRTADPDLHAVAGTQVLRGTWEGGTWRCAVPAGPLRLCSRRGTADGTGDPRRLGIAIAALSLDGAAIPLDGPVCAAGFHPPEQDGAPAWRWTDGDARLDLPAPGLLELRLGPTLTYWRDASARSVYSSAR